MHAEWDLSDGTRIEAKLVDLGRWSVRVNAVDVANTTTRLSLFENDTAFSLPDGRKTVMSVRKSLYGGAEIDLHLDGHAILCPGRRPFRCPACRIATRPDEDTCSSCQVALPDRAHRVQQRRFRGLAWNVLTNPLFAVAFTLVATLVTVRDPSVVSARLQLVHGDSTANELRERAVTGAWGALGSSVLLLVAFIGLALLSRRLPVVAAAVNLAFWACALVLCAFGRPSPGLYVLGFLVIFVCASFRGFRIALQIRAVEASFRQQTHA